MNRNGVDQERKPIEVDGMLRQRRRKRRQNKELPSDFTLLVPSVLQGLALQGRVHLQWPSLTTILPRCWVGRILCSPFPYLILTSFRHMTYRSKGFLQGDDWWKYRNGELSCNSGSAGLSRDPAVDTEATLGT